MGKYTAVVGKLPKFLGTEPAFQDKVNTCKSDIINNDPLKSREPAALAREYAKLRYQEEEIDRIKSELNVQLTAYEQLLADSCEIEGMSGVALLGGDKVRIELEPYAQVKDRDAHRQWCIKSGLERSLALPWGTTNALTKQALLDGEPIPDGVVAHCRTKVVFTKGKEPKD